MVFSVFPVSIQQNLTVNTGAHLVSLFGVGVVGEPDVLLLGLEWNRTDSITFVLISRDSLTTQTYARVSEAATGPHHDSHP